MDTRSDLLPTQETEDLAREVVRFLAIDPGSPLRLLGATFERPDAASVRPLELEDCLGLGVVNLTVTVLFKFVPTGQQLRLPDLGLWVDAALLCALQAYPELARKSGFFPSSGLWLHPDALWERASLRLQQWFRRVLYPTIQKGTSLEAHGDLTPREVRLLSDWCAIAQGAAIPIDGPRFLRIMNRALKPTDSSDETQPPRHLRDDVSQYINWLGQLSDGDVSLFFRSEDGTLIPGWRQLRDLLERKLGATVRQTQPESLDDPLRSEGSLTGADLERQERELAPDEAAAVREFRDLLVDQLDGIDVPTKAAVVYEFGRDHQGKGARSRKEIAGVYGVEPHQVEYRGREAAEIVRRLRGRIF